MSKIICIDPGHGGSDVGATAIDGSLEKEFTLSLGLALRDELVGQYECAVVMTRETDVYVDLGERAMIANRAKADLLISLHHDSAGNPLARGGSMYIHTNKRNQLDPTKLAWLPAVAPNGVVNHGAPNSYRLAAVMVPTIKAELSAYGIPWQAQGDTAGLLCADFWVLDQCWGACALLECYYGSNANDNWAAKRPAFVPDLTSAIAQGLVAALELSPRASAPHEQAAAAVAATSQLDKLAAHGLIDSPRDPKAPVTWEELATLLNRVMERRVENPS